MVYEIVLRLQEVSTEKRCRVCSQDAKYVLKNSSFDFNEKEINLVDAFNEFSSLHKVSLQFQFHFISVLLTHSIN